MLGVPPEPFATSLIPATARRPKKRDEAMESRAHLPHPTQM
jgi:hypothetical protein